MADKPIGRGAKILQELKAMRAKEQADALAVQMGNLSIVGGGEQVGDKPKTGPSRENDNPFLRINDLDRTNEGSEISTRINCLRLRFKRPGQQPRIFQYHASFSPDIDGRSARTKLVTPLLAESTSVFDGSIAYVYGRPLECLSTCSNDVEVQLQLVKELNEYPTFVLNNIFRAVMNDLRMVLMRRSYFSVVDSVRLPQHRLEVWPGFVTSIDYVDNPDKPGQREMLLTMDVSNRVLRTMTCLDMYTELMELADNTSRQRMQEQFTKAVSGCVVLTRYNNRTYRVDGVEWDKSINDTFVLNNGNSTTFRDYYERFHNLKCTDEKQPLLLSRIRRTLRAPREDGAKYTGRSSDGFSVLLVPEFCYATGLSDALRSDFKAMKDLSSVVHLSPARRLDKLKSFVRNVNSCEVSSKRLSDWDLHIPSEDVVSVPARVLPSERIVLGNGQALGYGYNADWGKELSRSSVLSAVPVQNWLLLYPKRLESLAASFVDTVFQEAGKLGLSFATPTHRSIVDDRTGTYVRALREELGDGGTIELVVVLFPSQREDRYSAIKRLCCVDIPVASQVICARSLSNANKARTICQRIMLQINCKMGGSLWTVPIPVSGLMVCGIDVFHGGMGSEGMKSVGAVVCSTNRECSRWYSRITIQSTRQELIDGLKACISAAIRCYHGQNFELPQKIILFRDGVGDGNFNVVRGYELEQITSCFKAFTAEYEPQFAALIIHKRINNRIMSDDKMTGGPTNPAVGTVVDTPMTRRSRPNEEFLLVSQHVNQGTVNPTRFILVANTTKLNLDRLQRLTFKLTHMYYNWPGTVRVPAPCVYAHKLAYLVGQSVQFEPAEVLADRLYYL